MSVRRGVSILPGWFPAVVVTLLLLATVPREARGQDSSPAAEQREVTARHLFAVGKYAEALDIFAALYAETTHPTYLRNIGRCYQNLGEPDKAISSFNEYLRQVKNLPADQRTLIEGYVREMEELKRKRETERVVTAPAQPERAVVPAEPVAAAPTVPAAASPSIEDHAPSPAEEPPSRMSAYIVGGASLAAIGVGSFFGLQAISNKNAAAPLCPMKQCDPTGYDKNQTALTDARVSDVAFAAGIIGAGIATYLFVAHAPARPGHAVARLRLLPALVPGIAALTAETSW
jgi:hypothetical protein